MSHALHRQQGPAALLAAMQTARAAGAFGAEYLTTLLQPKADDIALPPVRLDLVGVPSQDAIDRRLASYEVFVEGARSDAGPRPACGGCPAGCPTAPPNGSVVRSGSRFFRYASSGEGAGGGACFGGVVSAVGARLRAGLREGSEEEPRRAGMWTVTFL